RRMAETKPDVDEIGRVQQHHARERHRHALPLSSTNSRSNNRRSMSATVVPWRNAATLTRPRSSGVTSIVNRAEYGLGKSPPTLLTISRWRTQSSAFSPPRGRLPIGMRLPPIRELEHFLGDGLDLPCRQSG